jgi:hypothetical protein
MPLEEYDKTLVRFQLEKLKNSVDLQLTKSGDIAITRDGDLQMGDVQSNAMFRLVERWRQSESTINELFGPMLRASRQLEELTKARELGESPSLGQDPKAYHHVTEAIIEYQSLSSVLAGSIFVVANNFLQRFKKDLNASCDEWKLAVPQINNFSIGEIFSAAAANFRHYDEWARTKVPNEKQLAKMTVLCGLLAFPVQTKHGFPTIRTNVCGSVLMMVSEGSVDHFHQITFDYAKALGKYQ